MLFAGIILEGGIIGYDSNTVTGGIGARYLGIGGDVQYRQDTVTVYLNAISSRTGEILKSVMTRKTVASYGVRGSVFKFVAFQKLLEGETGYTVNEPGSDRSRTGNRTCGARAHNRGSVGGALAI